ncbi:MAG: tyrosine-type recombinase/integrase, partial [bacterium]|nr:tyrosine-type recombinase/integrase [bacterium]
MPLPTSAKQRRRRSGALATSRCRSDQRRRSLITARFFPQDGARRALTIEGRKAHSHLTDLKGPWKRLRERACLENLRIHDLRHSFAAVGAGLGLSLPMIGKLLGHSQPETTARYAHLAADPMHE